MTTKSKEHVTVFGEGMRDHDEKWGGKRGGSLAGFIFIAAGILLLLNTFNVVSWDVWQYIIRFWPLLFIIWGIKILLGTSLVSRVILDIVTFLLVVLVVLFAIREVNPSVVAGLPPEFNAIFQAMKGVQQ